MHCHYSDVIMDAMASQITGVSIVYSTVCSDADQRKCQSSASLAFMRRIHRLPEFPTQRAINAENISIWWRHYGVDISGLCYQRQVSRTWISKCTPQNTEGCNYLSMPKIPASCNKILTCDVVSLFYLRNFSGFLFPKKLLFVWQ